MPPYSLQHISGPEDEPLTLAEAKAHPRIENSDEDAYIESLIPVARQAIEHRLGKPIGEQVFELGLPCWPYCLLEIPRPPLLSIVSIKYRLEDETTETLYDSTSSPVTDSDVFAIDTSSEPGLLYLRSGESWPADVLAPGFPVRIRFKAGMTTVPECIQHAMKFLVAHLFENREPVNVGNIVNDLPMTVEYLIQREVFKEFR